jgi:basic membrane protein A and related proteins
MDQKQTNRSHNFILVALSIALPTLALSYALSCLGGSAHAANKLASKVGLVTDLGTLNDMGFNWMSYQGLLRAQSDFGIVGTVYTSTTEVEFTTNLQQCVAEGNALCFSVGYSMSDATADVAGANPSVKFAILDFAYTSYPANIRGITFNVNEPAYLAGILAGSMSQSKIVGEIGGMSIPAVNAFILPFRNGAQCASPSATALITYTNNFSDPDLGARVAQTLISRSADAILVVAGSTGNGAILTATQSGAWGIGVDIDFYSTIFNDGAVAGSDKLLSSVLKKLDTAVYLTIQDMISNKFTSGTTIYNFASDGVGLAPFHETDSAIPAPTKARLEQVRNDILAGRLDVNSTICRNFAFLPLVLK